MKESRERSWSQSNRLLLQEARRAKEILSKSPDYEVYVPPPVDRDLRVTSDELNGLISSDLEGTVAELERTIRGAGLEPNDLSAIYLAGGSSRIPLVARLIQQRLGQLPDYLDDPKSVIVLGAARIPAPETAPVTVTGRRAPQQQRTEFAPVPDPTEAQPVGPTEFAPVPTEPAPLPPRLRPRRAAPAPAAAAAAFPALRRRPRWLRHRWRRRLPDQARRATDPLAHHRLDLPHRGDHRRRRRRPERQLIEEAQAGGGADPDGRPPRRAPPQRWRPVPNVVAEGDADDLLSRFEAISDSDATTPAGFARSSARASPTPSSTPDPPTPPR